MVVGGDGAVGIDASCIGIESVGFLLAYFFIAPILLFCYAPPCGDPSLPKLGTPRCKCSEFGIRTGLLPLTTVMRRLLTGYAVGFNRRHNRHGQLFQNMMTDERILGDSEFVDSVLSQANERYERRYELKPQGYDLDRIAKRVAEIYGMERQEVFSKGRQQRKVKARSLLCFWAVREIGMSLRELAQDLEMSAPGVGFAVERGEAIAHRNGYKLIG